MKNYICWFKNEKNKYIQNDKQYKLSLIEMLVAMEIPTELFLFSVNKNIDIVKVKDTKRSKVKIKDVYPYWINKDQCTYEAKLCQMVYGYINYNMLWKVDKSWGETWNEMLTFINILMDSKASSTMFWWYEIINLWLYKLPLRETITDKSIKKQWSVIIISLFNRLLDLSIIDKYDSLFEEPSMIITPLPPSIYEKVASELYGSDVSKINPTYKVAQRGEKSNLGINNNAKNKGVHLGETKGKMNVINDVNESKDTEESKNWKEAKDTKEIKDTKDNKDQTNSLKNSCMTENSVHNFYNLIKTYIENSSIIKNEDLTIAYRNIGFITLKSVFYTTMKNIFSQEKMIPYFQTLIKNLITIMNEKVNFNRIYVDLATDFLHSLIKNASSITCGSCKQLIMDFFLEPEFFNMSLTNLRLWKDIISEFAHSYQGIINDLMDKINQGSFFNKNTDQFNIKAMRRISFIIYSCPKDTFSNKLGVILEKVKEIITKYSENPTLESEIFLMLRIMFLRFSHESLIEMIRALWPIIFGEIVNVIKSKRKITSLELNVSGWKLVELLSVANMDEFCLYQWIFFVDTFRVASFDTGNDQCELMDWIKSDNKAFKPFALAMTRNWDKWNDMIESYKNKKYEDFDKRSLMIQLQKIASEDELSKLVTRVIVYISIMNNFRNVIDLDVIESVIENDFLTNTVNTA